MTARGKPRDSGGNQKDESISGGGIFQICLVDN